MLQLRFYEGKTNYSLTFTIFSQYIQQFDSMTSLHSSRLIYKIFNDASALNFKRLHKCAKYYNKTIS
jgi:hypothetical protein